MRTLFKRITPGRVLAPLGLVLAALLMPMPAVSPANAQATRTWVSGVGDDANPCSRTAPCKTFAGAISKTAAKGEINCLDPGGFGAVTITKSISIICVGVEAGVLVSGTNGIVINVAATDRVLLEGLDIEGVGTGLNGVRVVGAGLIIIRNCSIRGFTQNAVELVGVTATPAPRVLVQNSILTGNAGGIFVHPTSPTVNNAEVLNTLIDTNTTFGIQVDGPSALVLSASTVTGQPSAIIVANGGQVISYGNNVLRNAGAPTSTLPLQ